MHLIINIVHLLKLGRPQCYLFKSSADYRRQLEVKKDEAKVCKPLTTCRLCFIRVGLLFQNAASCIRTTPPPAMPTDKHTLFVSFLCSSALAYGRLHRQIWKSNTQIVAWHGLFLDTNKSKKRLFFWIRAVLPPPWVTHIWEQVNNSVRSTISTDKTYVTDLCVCGVRSKLEPFSWRSNSSSSGLGFSELLLSANHKRPRVTDAPKCWEACCDWVKTRWQQRLSHDWVSTIFTLYYYHMTTEVQPCNLLVSHYHTTNTKRVRPSTTPI